jgi:hypothetical protein
VIEKGGVSRNKTAMIKVSFVQLGETATRQEQVVISNLKFILEEIQGLNIIYRLY